MEDSSHSSMFDPDYKDNPICTSRQSETENIREKVKRILTSEFEIELQNRQRQLEAIESQICKTQKLLHLVRYAVISSYYNRSELEYGPEEEKANDLNTLIGQRRLHPALKKILGANGNLDFLAQRSKRKAALKNTSVSISSPEHQKIESKTKKVKHVINEEHMEEQHFNDSQSNTENNVSNTGTRKKVKHMIIVGNISMWMPSESEESNYFDNSSLSHKWMVYVRGPKEMPEVSHFVEKVVFFLHPSFKPHDVLEVSKPPFHLKKIGWGEFPMRVQIHFKNPLNKPVDVIHLLKLPKEHPGKQVLGNETIVDIHLHEEITHASSPCFNEEISYSSNATPKTKTAPVATITKVDLDEEPMDLEVDDYMPERTFKTEVEVFEHNVIQDFIKQEIVEEEIIDCASSSFEHDYCFAEADFLANAEVSTENIVNGEVLCYEHCYSLPSGSENLSIENRCIKQENNFIEENDLNNSFIYGLGDNYLNGDDTLNSTLGHLSDKFSNDSVDKSTKVVNHKLSEPNLNSINTLPVIKNGQILFKKNQPLFIKKVLQKQVDMKFKPVNISIVKSRSKNCNGQNKKKCSGKNSVASGRESLVSSNKTDIVKNASKLIVPKDRYKNVGELLPFLFKNLPLFNNQNCESKYGYSFTAKSYEEFCSWNIGKRLNSEWLRAKTILRILKTSKIGDWDKWNTRALMMYGRSHCYTPYTSYNIYNIFKRLLPETILLSTCYSRCDTNRRKFIIDKHKVESEISVDVVADSTELSKENNNSVLDISDPRVALECTYIRQCALDCGVVLKSEEIEPGIKFNGAERLVYEAVKSLADNLIRRATSHLVCSEVYGGSPGFIREEHVQLAIEERPEIQSILEFGKRRRDMEFFT